MVSDIPAGDGKTANLFLQCGDLIVPGAAAPVLLKSDEAIQLRRIEKIILSLKDSWILDQLPGAATLDLTRAMKR